MAGGLHSEVSQPLKKVEKDADRDYYMTAEEAKTYGLIDKIVEPKEVLKPKAVKLAAAVAA